MFNRILRPRWALAAVTLIVLGLATACFSDRDDPVLSLPEDCNFNVDPALIGQATTLVAIRNFAFAPTEIRVKAGETVTWINCEPPGTENHTVTSDEGIWDSPLLDTGNVFTRTFDTRGEFPYHCTPHPFMQATVIVE